MTVPALDLWLFWVALVALVGVLGAAPLFGAVYLAARARSVLPAVIVVVVFLVVWVPLLVYGIGLLLGPWARTLGLAW